MTPSKPKKSTPEKTDKLPPNDQSAEQGALGVVLLDSAGAWEAMGRLIEILRFSIESFYDLRHRTIYEAMLDLFNQRKPIDFITVKSILETRSQLESVGGVAYLATLPDKVPSQAMADHYAEIVNEKAVLREIIRIGLTAVQKVDQCEEPATLINWLENRVIRLSASGTRSGIEPMSERVAQAIDVLDKIQSEKIEPGGLQTGIKELDEKTMGLMNGDYIILAGRPSTGKSALALNIMDYLAIDRKVPVGFISLEMTGTQLTNRIISSRASVDSFRIQRTKLTDDELMSITRATGKISRAPLYICDQVKRDLNSIKSAGRRLKIDHKIKILAIDFLQLMFTAERSSRSIHEDIGFISGEIKQLALELNIPILMISQLNRESDKHKKRAPRLSDLRGSGTIEENADVILLMWRPGGDDESEPVDIVNVQLLIEKQRNGPTGAVDLSFHRKYTQFKARPKIAEDSVPVMPFMQPGMGLTPEERGM